MTIFIRTTSSLENVPDKMALLGIENPVLVFANSCDIKSFVGVT